jgi:hypothetical protein
MTYNFACVENLTEWYICILGETTSFLTTEIHYNHMGHTYMWKSDAGFKGFIVNKSITLPIMLFVVHKCIPITNLFDRNLVSLDLFTDLYSLLTDLYSLLTWFIFPSHLIYYLLIDLCSFKTFIIQNILLSLIRLTLPSSFYPISSLTIYLAPYYLVSFLHFLLQNHFCFYYLLPNPLWCSTRQSCPK